MGIASAFYTALSGLSVNSGSLTVIGNNLANLNTIGFKGSSTTFQDLFSTTLGARAFQGNGNPSQVGLGAMIGAVMQNFGQSTFQSTSNSTDMAVQGQGFFSVKLTAGGGLGYTRAGNFTINQAGYLVDPAGNCVQGWTNKDKNGHIVVTDPPMGADIRIPVGEVVPGKVTQTVAFTTNLNAADPIGTRYNSSIVVYDSIGSKHTLVMSYNKISDQEWEYYVWSADANCPWSNVQTGHPPDGFQLNEWSATGANGPGYYKIGPPADFHSGGLPIAAGKVVFGPNGSMVDPVSGELWNTAGANTAGISIYDLDPASANYLTEVPQLCHLTGNNQTYHCNNLSLGYKPDPITGAPGIEWRNGTSIQPIEWELNKMPNGKPVITLTQVDQASGTTNSYQNGHGAGSIKGITVDQNGFIIGTFTNGQTYAVGQVALTTFANNNGLQKIGENIWMETIASGAPSTGVPNDVGRGAVLGSHLEMSNVDVADEFTRLIITQRGYQANSRIVTTSDEMMQETLALKR